MIRTKIISTLGPASSEVTMLRRLFEEGTDICRLNFSHGQLSDHLRMLQNIREAASHIPEPIAVLGDLGGPKIRLGPIADEQGTGGMPVAIGDSLHIQRHPITGSAGRVSTTYPRLVDDVRLGDRLLIEDGLLRFIVTDKTPDELVCACTVGGILKTGKGVNLPNTPLSLPSITERDWQSVNWAIENDLDYLALSFVRRPDELHQLRRHLEQRRAAIGIIAKIEKSEAIEHIDAILDASDGLMVARGDLGVEMDVARVPVIQKDLIRRCQKAGKPVIVATQMLQSMIEQATPTRAEVSDVANAVFDGTDAVMLSGETSVGKYPAGAVHMMNRIVGATEQYLDSSGDHPLAQFRDKAFPVSAAIAAGIANIIRDLRVRVVVVWSQSGDTARVFSKHRFSVPVVALSNNPRVLRQMALHYGIIPRQMSPSPDMPALIARVDQFLREQRLANPADRIVLAAGSSMAMPGTINAVIIHTLGAAPTAAKMVPESFGAVELER